MNQFKLMYYWLIITSWLITGFGLYIVVLAQTPLVDNFNKPVLAAFNLIPDMAAPQKVLVWIYSVLGATMAGWGIFICFVIKNAFLRKEKWSWLALIVSVSVWFVPDTLISTIYGVYFNVALNSILLLIIILPLSFTYKDFFQKEVKE